ncbi:hypothetical protein DRO54_07360 [Candidatus Bathyarchaeota archaeon]|nr:MAG: hypothetical protein DRO54_07360 [Candidatus Bathyarchaeota archaeon]
MEKWFAKRRKTKLLKLANRQITLSIDTVTDLDKAINSVLLNKKEEAKKSIERLFVTEVEIDNLRRAVFEEATKGDLPSKEREDLLHLVKRLDVLADHVKDSARNVLILLDEKIPNEIWSSYTDITSDLVECATTLRKALEKLGANPPEAMELAKEVDRIEGKVDDKYLKAKWLLLQQKEFKASTIIILKDLLDLLEQIADTCCDTADYIRVLTVSA